MIPCEVSGRCRQASIPGTNTGVLQHEFTADGLEVNVSYQLLPPLAQADIDRPTASFRERGVKMPVVVDEDNVILDGHNWAMIADSLGTEYPRVIEIGLDNHEKRIRSAALNVARRQLTDAQKIQLGRTIEPDIAARAEKRMLAGTQPPTLGPNGPRVGETGKTCYEVAATVQVGSGEIYERGKELLKALEQEPDGEHLMANVASGDWNMQKAVPRVRVRPSRVFVIIHHPRDAGSLLTLGTLWSPAVFSSEMGADAPVSTQKARDGVLPGITVPPRLVW